LSRQFHELQSNPRRIEISVSHLVILNYHPHTTSSDTPALFHVALLCLHHPPEQLLAQSSLIQNIPSVGTSHFITTLQTQINFAIRNGSRLSQGAASPLQSQLSDGTLDRHL
jgi:hypothetical protein